MELRAERQDNVLIVEVDGRIDGTTAMEFEGALRSMVTENDNAVALDFNSLSYISSAGLRAVLLSARTLQRQNSGFALFSLTDTIRAIFQISGFDKIISIYDTQAEAMASLGASPPT